MWPMTMTRYVAFLRGLNVGGHTVKMDQLRTCFEALGFSEVSTFIASGNVIFSTDGTDETADTDVAFIESRIERALKEALGYEVATFLRTDAEVAQIARHPPPPNVAAREGDTNYVLFLKGPVDAATRRRILALSNDEDVLHVHERELYWLRRGSLLDTTIPDREFNKALSGVLTTNRNINTVRRLAAKYPPREG